MSGIGIMDVRIFMYIMHFTQYFSFDKNFWKFSDYNMDCKAIINRNVLPSMSFMVSLDDFLFLKKYSMLHLEQNFVCYAVYTV